LSPQSGARCSVRQTQQDPCRWLFDFDPAAPGGRGGASILLDPALGLASIDLVHRNDLPPKRSTGGLVAEGLAQTGMPRPAILEAYNVEKSTRIALAAGGNGRGTLLGNFLEDTAAALGGAIVLWQPVADGSLFHLRVHVRYP